MKRALMLFLLLVLVLLLLLRLESKAFQSMIDEESPPLFI